MFFPELSFPALLGKVARASITRREGSHVSEEARAHLRGPPGATSTVRDGL